MPGSGTRALSAGQRRCRLRVRNQAKWLHGSCIAQGASITSLDRALGDRGERSPPERDTGVDLSRPWRAISAGAGHRSGLERRRAPRVDLGDRGERSPPERATGVDLSDRGERSPPERATGVDFGLSPSIHRDTLPDLAVGHRKPCLILERNPGF